MYNFIPENISVFSELSYIRLLITQNLSLHSFYYLSMGSTYVTYVNRTGAKTTFKLAYCGYTYTRRAFSKAKDAEYLGVV